MRRLSSAPDPVDIGNAEEQNGSIFSLAMVEHLRIIVELHEQQAVLDEVARRMTATLRKGGKILLCGNGGSAADAQHLAAEMVGRFLLERRGLAAIALTTDSSVLTSIANDYGYKEVFCRQVEALACPGDLLVGLSTSGESENVCAAVAAARLMDVYTVALCGEGGGRLAELADIALRVPSGVTARIQEAHIFCGHVLCASVEAALFNEVPAEKETQGPWRTWPSSKPAVANNLPAADPETSGLGSEPLTIVPSPAEPGRSGWKMKNNPPAHQGKAFVKWL